jgi:hypothetical protein
MRALKNISRSNALAMAAAAFLFTASIPAPAATEGVSAAPKPASYAGNAKRIADMQEQLRVLTQKAMELQQQVQAMQPQQDIAAKQAEDVARIAPAAGK